MAESRELPCLVLSLCFVSFILSPTVLAFCLPGHRRRWRETQWEKQTKAGGWQRSLGKAWRGTDRQRSYSNSWGRGWQKLQQIVEEGWKRRWKLQFEQTMEGIGREAGANHQGDGAVREAQANRGKEEEKVRIRALRRKSRIAEKEMKLCIT